LPAGHGRLVESVYLLHAGELPDYAGAQLGAAACVVSRIAPGSLAEREGLAVGDVLFVVDGHLPPEADPCFASRMLRTMPAGRKMSLGVFRSQAPFFVRLRAPGAHARFGWEVRRLPILKPSQWSVGPVRGGRL
jgi:S1-C subfamily serine protease